MIEGIIRGLEHRKHKPVVDGIVSGVPRKTKLKDTPDLTKVVPSATESAEGVFGAGRTPQGDGNGKAGPKGIRLAHEAVASKPVLKKMAAKAADMTHAM